MNSLTEHYVNTFNHLHPELPGQQHEWLQQTRQHALTQFSNLGFPSQRQEDWKYTNIRALEKQYYTPKSDTTLGKTDIAPFLLADFDCHLMVFINGYFSAEHSDDSITNQLTIDHLAHALTTDKAAKIKPFLGRYADIEQQGFTALNTAFMNDGLFIHIPTNVVVDKPIYCLYITDNQTDDVCSLPRNLIVADAAAKATIIENFVSISDAKHFTNTVSELVLAPQAQIDHYKLHQEADQAYHIARLEVDQAADSTFTSHSIAVGGRLIRNDINVKMQAEGTTCTLNGLYLGTGRQHIDYHTHIDHLKPHGNSYENYKGILSGHARAVFNGQVYVHPDAQKTYAEQSNSNLLLSDNAEIDTKPQLEIYADDVQCSHGATVGQLDENMLFYLRARGIDYDTARGMLTYGFAHDIIARMSLQPVQNYLEALLIQQLPKKC